MSAGIFDTHVHFADPARFTYPGFAGAPSLARRVTPPDLTGEIADLDVQGYLFVEVNVGDRRHLDEAAWAGELAASDARLRGIIAALPVEDGRAIEPNLARLRQNPLLCGIRRLFENHPDPDFCLRPGFFAGLEMLAEYDLPFDICVRHHQLPAVIRMVEAHPLVRFVLDHMGKPPISTGAIEPWRTHILELAAMPNIHCKISGLVIDADRQRPLFPQIAPFVLHAIEAFGFDRVMFGSDWHVLSLVSSYGAWVEMLEAFVADAPTPARQKLFRDNGMRFYGPDC